MVMFMGFDTPFNLASYCRMIHLPAYLRQASPDAVAAAAAATAFSARLDSAEPEIRR
jgi:hypothetical protein